MTSKQPSRFDPIRKLAPTLQKTTLRWGTVRRLKGDMIRCLLTSRLDIDRRRGLSLGAPRQFASEDAKPVHHPVVSSVVAPRVKIVPNRRNGQKQRGNVRHRHSVSSMCLIALTAFRKSIMRDALLAGGGRNGSTKPHFSFVKWLSARSRRCIYCVLVVSF